MSGDLGTVVDAGGGQLVDVVLFGGIFLAVLAVCALLGLAVRWAWFRWGPPAGETREGTADARMREAARDLEAAGVDLPDILGDWAPGR